MSFPFYTKNKTGVRRYVKHIAKNYCVTVFPDSLCVRKDYYTPEEISTNDFDFFTDGYQAVCEESEYNAIFKETFEKLQRI